MRAHLFIAAGMVAALWAPLALADVHYVSAKGENVPPYTSPEIAARDIGDALDIAQPGDRVQVLPGMYWLVSTPDDYCHVGDHVDLMGSGPAATTIIGYVRIGQGARMSGFTLTGINGTWDHSGGVCLGDESVTSAEVSDCVFDGVGIACPAEGADNIRVTRCAFGKLRTRPGCEDTEAIIVWYSGLIISDCTFDLEDRQQTGVVFGEVRSPAVVRNCRFTGCHKAISGGEKVVQITNRLRGNWLLFHRTS